MEQREFETLKSLIENHNTETSENSRRMDRIESKLDQLTNAVVAIARAEEKITSIVKDIKDVETMANSHEKQIGELKLNVTKNTNQLNALNRFFWILIAAITTTSVTAISLALGII